MQVQARATVVVLFLLLTLCLPALGGGKVAQRSQLWEQEFHSVMPLGPDAFVLEGHKGAVMLMATAVAPELEGWKRIAQEGSWFVYASDGSRARTYPQQVQFRVTVSASERPADIYEPLQVKSEQPLNEYLLGLQFRIKIFHGLQVQVVEPSDVHMLGVPADIPYDERIYRLSFQLPPVPVQDRMVLEVLSPEGDRLAKFHFELL